MISCLIWPLSVSWHHHNGLGTQNTNLHIMTSAYLWKIDCISVNVDQFSSTFRYVVAKTILYKVSKKKKNHFDDVIIVKISIKGLMSKGLHNLRYPYRR